MFLGLLVAAAWALAALAVGYPAYRLLAAFGESKTPVLDRGELLFVSALLGTLIMGWVALALAEAGVFGLPLFAAALLLLAGLAAAGAWMRRPRETSYHAPARLAPASLAGGLCLLAVSVALFFHPSEYILGGADAGVYVNLGAIIARDGALLVDDGDLAALSPALWPGLLRSSPPDSPAPYIRFPGFYAPNPGTGLVIPQFFPLHPVWLAIGHALLGLHASLYVTPLWSALAVLALALALRRAFGGAVGLLAALLLAISPLQVYFARYLTAEPLTQFLIWSGVYALIAYDQDEAPVWGVAGGLALGQVFLTRIDALPLLLLPLAWLLSCAWRRMAWFLVPFAAVMLHAAFHALVYSWPYTWDTYGDAATVALAVLGRAWWLLPVAGLGVAALIWLLGRHRVRAAGEQAVRRTGAGALVSLGLFAYFVWPALGETVMSPYWYGGIDIPVQNHLNLLRLGWYLSPLGIWLAVAGMGLMVLRGDGKRTWPILLAGLPFTLLYLYNIMNNPFHVYALRRYVPATVPLFAAGMAYALVWIWRQRERWRGAPLVAGALGIVLVGWLGYNNRGIWNLVEYRGAIEQVGALAGRLEPGAVLLFDDAVPVGAGSTVGTPLQYLYGFTAFDLQEDQLDTTALAEQVATWQAAGRAVYWVEGPAPSGVRLPLPSQPAQEITIRLSRLEQSYDHRPVHRDEWAIPLAFYRLESP